MVLNGRMNIAGAILAGGKNTRMEGRNKAFLKMNNTPIVQNTIRILKKIFDEVILVTNSIDEYQLFKKDCPIIEDIIKNVGPLGGIHSALSYTTKEAVFFVACDMPNLHNEVIKAQIDQFHNVCCDAFVPRINGQIEPLHAIYRKTLQGPLEGFIQNSAEYAIKKFLSTIDVSYWDLDDTGFYRNVFSNINTPEEYREVAK